MILMPNLHMGGFGRLSNTEHPYYHEYLTLKGTARVCGGVGSACNDRAYHFQLPGTYPRTRFSCQYHSQKPCKRV